MDELNHLSEAEKELIADFFGKLYRSITSSHPVKHLTVFDNDSNVTDIWKNFERIISLVSEDADQIALRMMTLNRIGNEINSRTTFFENDSEQLPPDAVVTPEKLNRLLVMDEIIQFYLLAGGMIEHFTVELVIRDILTDSRKSSSQRSRIQRMSQSEREWLLYVGGTIDSGEKGEIRRAYEIRNSLVHNPSGDTIIEELEHVNSDIERTQDVLELLHEKLYEITINQRFANLLSEIN
jgi:hypothetical protein